MSTTEPIRDETTAAVHPGENRALDPQLIVSTVEILRNRILERFPGSGLGRLAEDLLRISGATMARLRWVAEPRWGVRAAIGAVILLIVTSLVWAARFAFSHSPDTEAIGVTTMLQMVESVLNLLFLLGAAIFSLVTIEARIKRRRALRFLRELRAIAHIVDMHQLTKDPDRFIVGGQDTPSSPVRQMTRFDLGRYLDYCSEMLSLISKIAALYVQNFDDAVVLQAVDEVETLTSGLSRKIWQKIMVLELPGNSPKQG